MNNGRNKFLVILVVILLLTNAGMLWYFTSNTGNDKGEKLSRSERQVAFMKKELNLDSAQVDQYRALRIRRDSVMRPLNDSLREAKLKMIAYLKESDVSDSVIEVFASEIAARQKPIELESYRHFQRVRSLCNPEQTLKYDSMLVRYVNRNTGKDEKKEEKKK